MNGCVNGGMNGGVKGNGRMEMGESGVNAARCEMRRWCSVWKCVWCVDGGLIVWGSENGAAADTNPH